jgi:hypothetical protein
MARRPEDAGEEARARGAVAREIGKAQRAIRGLRAFFGANAVVSALVLALAFVVLPTGDGQPSGAALLVLAYLGVQTVALAAGTFLLPRNPFPWAVGMATLVTLGTLLRLAEGRFGAATMLSAVWSTALWAAAFGARRLEPLLRENPGSYAARRARGETEAAPEGAASARARLRERRALRGRRKGLAGFWAIAAAVVVVGGLSLAILLSPPSLDRFQEAWDAGDAETLGSLFRDPRGGRRADSIGTHIEKRGWSPRPPAVTERRIERQGKKSAVVLFYLGEGEGNVETVWRLEGDRWVLAKLQPPPR